MPNLRVYMGWDAREKTAYDVCHHSIIHNTPRDVEIIPLVHKQLRRQGWFARPWLTGAYDGNMTDLIDGKPFSTEFSHTRFLVPSLCNYEGWALFMDCDMIVDIDIRELFRLVDDKYAVMCVKHNHRPDEGMKMDDVPQTRYYRKNWSSFMLWNCGHPANKKLTPSFVNTQSGSNLHSFSWLHDTLIGSLPDSYNWIDGISNATTKPKVIHYTEGGPWFENYKEVIHADIWWKYYERWKRENEYEPVKETISVDYGMYSA